MESYMKATAEIDYRAYMLAKSYLPNLEIEGVTQTLVEKYLCPVNTDNTSWNMPALYQRLLLSAQNANMKAGVIGGSIGGIDKLGAVLADFSPGGVVSKYGSDWEAILNDIVSVLKPRGEVRRTPRSIWPRYCQTIISGALFFEQFESAHDFFQWADFFDRDDRSRASLPMLLSQEIAGFGFALSCDFLKEIGYINFPKPDVHLRDIFIALRLCDDHANDYQLFKAIIRLANHADVSPYNADKLFWLIGSGYFYGDMKIGSEGRIGGRKKDFIEFARTELYGEKSQGGT